jgi:hypothetical protein
MHSNKIEFDSDLEKIKEDAFGLEQNKEILTPPPSSYDLPFNVALALGGKGKNYSRPNNSFNKDCINPQCTNIIKRTKSNKHIRNPQYCSRFCAKEHKLYIKEKNKKQAKLFSKRNNRKKKK